MIALDSALAFSDELTPFSLWQSAEKLENDPTIPDEVAVVLNEYAATFADIRTLPERS